MNFFSFSQKVVSMVEDSASSAVDSIPKPTGEVVHVAPKGVTLKGIDLDVTVKVHNPYLVPLPVTSISYDMITVAGGRTIAKGVIHSPGVLNASGDTDLPVDVHIVHTAIIDLIRDAAPDWDIDYELTLGFIVDLPLLPATAVPFVYKSAFNLPTLNDLLSGKALQTPEQKKKAEQDAAKLKEEQKKNLSKEIDEALESLRGGRSRNPAFNVLENFDPDRLPQ